MFFLFQHILINPLHPRVTYRFYSNAIQFYSSKGDPLGFKGINKTKENVVLELSVVKIHLFLYVHFGSV